MKAERSILKLNKNNDPESDCRKVTIHQEQPADLLEIEEPLQKSRTSKSLFTRNELNSISTRTLKPTYIFSPKRRKLRPLSLPHAVAKNIEIVVKQRKDRVIKFAKDAPLVHTYDQNEDLSRLKKQMLIPVKNCRVKNQQCCIIY